MDREHTFAQESLPWLVNGTIAESDARRLQKHLAHCSACSADLETQMQIQAIMRAASSNVEYAPQSGLAKLNTRIDRALERRARRDRRLHRLIPGFGADGALTRYAIVAQAAAIAALAVAVLWIVMDRPANDYRTVTSPAAAVGSLHLQVVFENGTASATVQAAIDEVGGTILSGPSEHGVYVIGLSTDNATVAEDAARRLRDLPAVRFASANRD
jgi:anti-sigma factor RsiW